MYVMMTFPMLPPECRMPMLYANDLESLKPLGERKEFQQQMWLPKF
jgi:hypothetical protein